MSSSRIISFVLCGVFLLGWAPFSHAGSSSINVNATSNVSNTCAIQSMDNISLGLYQPSSALALQGSGQIKARCTKGASVSALPSSGGTVLTGTGDVLNYGLYIDSGLSKGWGAVTYQNLTLDFNQAQTIYMQQVGSSSTLTVQQCAALAQGKAFVFSRPGAATKTCWTNISVSNPGGYASYNLSGPTVFSYTNAQQTILLNASNQNLNSGIYLPQNTFTQVNPSTFTFQATQTGSGQALVGTSSSVDTPIIMTYYGKVPPSQDVKPGTYVDTVVVTLNF